MAIDFNNTRWTRVKNNYRRWWAGELKRPLLYLTVPGRDPGRLEPSIPQRAFTAHYDRSVSAAEIVDRWDYDLSCVHFMGDAFPVTWPNFGPGVIAAFMGATLETDANTCWFHPVRGEELANVQFRYDPDNAWLNRVKDIYRAAAARWKGSVQVSMTDLGGNLDILSSFRPSERLLLDLYDHPEVVKKKTWEAHEMWWRYFKEIDALLRPFSPGHTAWTPIFSETPYYMLQCDFCYMVGPGMFDEFVKPELAASCRRLSNPFYHLDGIGQLPHLESLLTIPELKGVQWIPGDGSPGPDGCQNMKHWPDVYRRIRKAGKLVQLFGTIDVLDTVARQVGSAEGMILIGTASSLDDARDALRRYGVEEG
jgi:hypothetical protein